MEIKNKAGGFDRRTLMNVQYHSGRLARAAAVAGMSREDYQQDLLLDLLHRQRAYDSQRSSFPTFADRVLKHRVSTILAPTHRRRAEQHLISLDTLLPTEDGAEEPLQDRLKDDTAPTDETISLQFDVRRFVASLPNHLLDCCEILVADSVAAGARATGINRSTIYDRTARLRTEAGARGLDTYVKRRPDTSPSSPVSEQDEAGASTAVTGPPEVSGMASCPGLRSSVTEGEFCRWLETARPGGSLEYHRGYLAMEASSGRRPRDVAGLARRARWASDNGRACLVQRRHGPGDYSYIAVLRRPVRSAQDAVSSDSCTEVPS